MSLRKETLVLARLRPALARRLRPDPDLALGIEAGQVVCPVRGIMDVEDCFTCSRFRGLRLDSDRVACAAPSPGLIPVMVGRLAR